MAEGPVNLFNSDARERRRLLVYTEMRQNLRAQSVLRRPIQNLFKVLHQGGGEADRPALELLEAVERRHVAQAFEPRPAGQDRKLRPESPA